MRRFCPWLLFAGLVFGASAAAQSAPAQSTGATTVTLGHSVVPLNGPWKFHVGDNPQWASPNFDDSGWETVDLTPKAGSIDPNAGLQGFVPGWTAKGHPGYSGYAWYRVRVRVTGADGALALLAPMNVDDSYQLFANGRLIGSFGNFSGSAPTIYSTRPLMFALPTSILQHSPDGTMTLAFRFYMAPRTLLQIDPGGMHDPPSIGVANAVNSAYHVEWETAIENSSSSMGVALLFLLFALFVLMLYVADRTEKILLWPLAASALVTLDLCLGIFSALSLTITQLQVSLADNILESASVGLWLITWLVYFNLSGKKWLRNSIIVFIVWRLVTGLLFQIFTLKGPHTSHFVFMVGLYNSLAISAAMVVLVVLILVFGIRKAQRVDWMLLLSIIFFGLPSLNLFLRLLHVRTTWFVFGTSISIGFMTDAAALFCFSFVLIRRFRASQRRQQAMVEDVKQAQEVQQVLIPEQLPQVPGLSIESEYLPAREVGGDFFQIIPHATDGSVLIVAGDVTGKGLQAGMLVALIVGAIRTAVEKSFDPLEMLQALNRRLCGRGNAHATCLAVRIAADGSATLANAGHMPPYLNGKELPMEGTVPLGMSVKTEFSVMRFQLGSRDRLMLLSDGVAEAQDEQGRLFGFERIQAMLATPISAAEIAAAARKFGQRDDICVLAIARAAVAEEVPA